MASTIGKLQQITVRFKPEDMKRIEDIAEMDNRPPANFVAWCVLKYIKQFEEKKQ